MTVAAVSAASGGLGGLIAAIAVVILVLLIVIKNVRIVPQASNFVVERLGGYHATWLTGLHVKLPFLDRVAKTVSLKEQVADFQPQAVITKDNVTMMIDTVLFFQITDPKMYTYGIEHPIMAIENLSATTLRNIIGDLELDETLTSRDLINAKMRNILDEATDPWGIKVNRVELKNIIPPKEIQVAMERQMKAEREKRENILRAEGEKEAAIRVAEGEKTAAILRAEAQKESEIRRAEGEAEAIRTIQEATAAGMRMIKEVGADQALIAIRSLEAMEKVANGQATKIIIPSELQGFGSLTATLKELMAPDAK
ncbi:MAG: SPFH/Band 7/PHB domain protein [Clostridia bacterium]|nr:SPFH/Band 7/PHB domain protein [Clostridia bacterium]